ncbi:LacI family DNA-binding transcriptional regulator [Jiangella rhizosphaerae]|uniref:LacI family transcriptional regulator n=1 Tax=Jiangella rhizosphaerae TaxID=2293569 RepID=A0A418KQZ6_9ACTN|nr:LacI family DNA-binding transcriptional regulator [Jiangella rhizosphaerae]RIQ22863.1 LacI family transcriptional regulator [Jiangella rhizosphaerae]
MVNRNDVARHAGVSVAVVSYVLNDGPRPVSAATRAKVLDAVRELDYRPNRVASALRSRRTWSIGLVVPDNSNPFFAQLAHAIEDDAFARGYSLLLGNASGDRAREQTYLETFQDRQVDGLIVVSNRPTAELARAVEGGVPLVVVSDHPVAGLPAVSTVKADNAGGARLVTEHLLGHGHRRIGCVLGPRDSAPSGERYAGWRQALEAAGVAPDDGLVRWTSFSRSSGHLAGIELLSRDEPPTAVFAATDHQAFGVLRAAADLGLNVPGDVAVMGFDGIAEADYSVPRLATAKQPITDMAARAVELLLRERHGGTEVHEVFPMTLLTRGSCGCPDPRTTVTRLPSP